MPEKSIAQKLHENVQALKAQGASQSEIDDEIAYWGNKLKAENAADKPQSVGDAIGAGAQTFSDAATLGLSGLADDAATALLTRNKFKDLRGARKASKEQFREENPVIGTGLELAGSLATPLPSGGLIKGAARGAGIAAKAGRAALDAGLQSGIAGTVGNLDELSGEGVGNAIGKGAQSAALGAAVGGPLGAAAGMFARGASRVKNLRSLDKKAFEIDDAIRAADKANYGAARGEAVSTPPIKHILENDPVLAPIAKDIRSLAAYKGKPVNDAEVAMQAYTRLSADERAAQRVIDRAEDYRPELAGEVERIGTAKQKLLAAIESPSEVVTMGRAKTIGPPQVAESSPPLSIRDALDRFKSDRAEGMWKRADVRGSQPGETVMQSKGREALYRRSAEARAPQTSGAPSESRMVTRESETIPLDAGIPSLRNAIDAKRVAEGERGAFERGADVGHGIGLGKSIKGKKLLTDSREAVLRDIDKMTAGEAEGMLAGIMGRIPESAHITNSPLGLFGTLSSAVRLPMQIYRTGPIIKKLEERLGRGALGDAEAMFTRGTAAREIGAMNSR